MTATQPPQQPTAASTEERAREWLFENANALRAGEWQAFEGSLAQLIREAEDAALERAAQRFEAQAEQESKREIIDGIDRYASEIVKANHLQSAAAIRALKHAPPPR